LPIVREFHNSQLTQGLANPYQDMRLTVRRSKLDKRGSAEREDYKARKVVAPALVQNEAVYHFVSRRHSQATPLACVSAVDDAIASLLIPFTVIRDSLWRCGLWQNAAVIVACRRPSYVI
jgi:hypothetical protein